jgi:bifunctional DNase/RNase
MAVRFDAPIYTTDEVLTEAGIMLELSDNDDKTEYKAEEEEEAPEIKGYEVYTLEEIQEMLDKAVQEEDFDTALGTSARNKETKKEY